LAKDLARLMPVNASPGPLRGRPSRSDLQQAGGRKAGDEGAFASHAQRLSNDRPVATRPDRSTIDLFLRQLPKRRHCDKRQQGHALRPLRRH